MKKTWLVAEIGCNHNGSFSLAHELVTRAKACGVDAVKFQTFSAQALISCHAPKAEYQKVTTGTQDNQLEMTRGLELPPQEYLRLRDYALSLGLGVFSTPFDFGSIDFLYKNGQTVWKIPSGEITNLPYLEKIASLSQAKKHVILSTGMATITEISAAIDILKRNGMADREITLLHCNTEYPTPDTDVNLTAIQHLQAVFPALSVGYSDHSVGWLAAVGAVAMGAIMIEKHFTLDKNLPGPDHKASATPEELCALCENVRRFETMLGHGKKEVTHSEAKNKIVARKSIVAARPITRGELFTEQNITCKRPGNGISPMAWYDILGQRAEKDFIPDDLIEHSAFPWQEPEL